MNGIDAILIKLKLNLRYYPQQGDGHSKHRFVGCCTAGSDPAQSYNSTCFYMANDCTGHGTGLGNDEELGDVD